MFHRQGTDGASPSGSQPSTSNNESQTEPARNFKKTLLENYRRQSNANETDQPQPSTSASSPSNDSRDLPSTSQSQPSTSTNNTGKNLFKLHFTFV